MFVTPPHKMSWYGINGVRTPFLRGEGVHRFREFSTFGRGIKHKRALKTRAAGVFSLLAQWFTVPGVLIGLIHPKGVFQPGHVPFLASVRHFCRVSHDVFFVSSLIPSRAYFVSCLIPSEIADFADGKNGRSGDRGCCSLLPDSCGLPRVCVRAGLILGRGQMAEMADI